MRPTTTRRLRSIAQRALVLSSVAMLLVVSGTPALAEKKPVVDLVGTWYVLIHYKDSSTANPDVDRWDERLWTFEQKGSRLTWSEYPIVVFANDDGRFGAIAGNPRARLLEAWEPNAEQLAQIQDGLPVNSRGMLKKSLRGSVARGYQSVGSMRSASAMTVGYQQTWSIQELTSKPVFSRTDTVGTAAAITTENAEGLSSGLTRYTTLEVDKSGDLLTGEFQRDENRAGTFRMMRAGTPRALPSDDRTPNEKQRDRMREQIRANMMEGGYQQFLTELDAAEPKDLRARIGDGRLRQLWSEYGTGIANGDARARKQLEGALAEQYRAALREDITLSLLAEDGTTEAKLAAAGVELDDEQKKMALRVRDALGEERIAELRSEYGERIAAGDAEAMREIQKILEEIYAKVIEDDLKLRLDQQDPEAIREMREYQRMQRDRRL